MTSFSLKARINNQNQRLTGAWVIRHTEGQKSRPWHDAVTIETWKTCILPYVAEHQLNEHMFVPLWPSRPILPMHATGNVLVSRTLESLVHHANPRLLTWPICTGAPLPHLISLCIPNHGCSAGTRLLFAAVLLHYPCLQSPVFAAVITSNETRYLFFLPLLVQFNSGVMFYLPSCLHRVLLKLIYVCIWSGLSAASSNESGWAFCIMSKCHAAATHFTSRSINAVSLDISCGYISFPLQNFCIINISP